MKTCPGCNSAIDDRAIFCTVCGNKFEENADSEICDNDFVNTNDAGAYSSNDASCDGAPYADAGCVFTADPTDHTAEFDAADVSSNKPLALLVYIGGIVGLVIAILMKKDSRYLDFHIRQSVKIYITELICVVVGSILSCFILPMIAAMIAVVVLLVVRIICFVQVAEGKSKEPYIVKGLNFLK